MNFNKLNRFQTIIFLPLLFRLKHYLLVEKSEYDDSP